MTGAFFLNAHDAWAETQHEWPAQPGATTTWQTTDGGATWHQGISLPGAPQYGTAGFDEFAFADAEHGFGFGVAGTSTSAFEQERQGSLWATSDGGRHWVEVAGTGLPWQGSSYSGISAKGCDEADPFNLTAVSAAVVFLAEAGCPVGQPGLWRSDDGGRAWEPVHLPVPPGGWASAEAWHYPGVGESGAEVLALRFFAGGQGVAAVTTRPGQLLVYRSSDAGESWSLAPVLETGSLGRPAGFWASSPWAWELPAPAGLYVTTDAGGRWALQRSGLSLPDMTEVSFASPASGVGFGSYPEVGLASTGDVGMRTSDGGRSWEALQFSAPAFLGNFSEEVPFGTVDFATALDGWVGGADGVAATTDGGSAWTAQLATSAPVEELSFSDATHGWALTPDELFATSDAGAHWSVVDEPALGAFSYVQLVNASFGIGVICKQAGGRACWPPTTRATVGAVFPCLTKTRSTAGAWSRRPGQSRAFASAPPKSAGHCSALEARAQAWSKRATTAAGNGQLLQQLAPGPGRSRARGPRPLGWVSPTGSTAASAPWPARPTAGGLGGPACTPSRIAPSLHRRCRQRTGRS